MLKTKNQSRVSISGLTYNNLIEDAYNALKDSDEFKNNFTSFTSNSAERMIVELYAYVASQLANRMDQMGNELFVDTASASGLSRLMKLVGARLDFPAAAETKVTVSTSSPTRELTFTSGINNPSDGTELNYVSGSFKRITANNGTSWEFIKKEVAEDGEFTYDYTAPYSFTGSSDEYILQEGITHAKSDYIINSVNIDTITLIETPVIKNSVRIYYKDKVLKEGTTDTYEIKEMKRVDNFFTTDALKAKTGIYTVRNMGGGRCEISIKPYYNDSENISDLGKSLLIMYRTGGGEDGNISIGAIDLVEQFTIIGSDNKTTGYGQLTIENTEGGTGGEDELTTDQIRATVLQEVRNTKIAITEEDYEYLLPKYDNSIELIKCYGEKNDEIADLSETYGYYVNPLNVWLIILKYNKEFNDAYMNDTSAITDRINDIAFSTLDINPRFNEKYQVNSAYLNQIFRTTDFENYKISNNRYSFPIDKAGVDLLSKKDCQITVTNYPYIETAEASRRGINSFKKYSGYAPEKTWDDVKTLSSASKGDVYLVTTVDELDQIYNRWICTQSFDHVLTDEEFDQHWSKVDFSYIYDNLISIDQANKDVMWIQQSVDSADMFYPVYSNLPYSFSGNWDVLRESRYYDPITGKFTIPLGTQVIITINGQPIIIPGGTSFNGLQALADYINSKIDPSTNIIFLKENIPASPTATIESDADYTGGNANLVIELEGQLYTIPFDPSGVNTYDDLIDKLNDSFEAVHLDDKLLAVKITYNDCLNIAIISGSEFTYKDGETDGTNAIYTYLLNNEEPEWPLRSSVIALTADQAAEWGGYLASQDDIAFVGEDGLLHIGFSDSGETNLGISGSTEIATLFKKFFDIADSTDEETVYSSRILNISYSEDAANLIISMASSQDELTEDIYINIFGPKNGEIKLGSYYENIEEYLADVPDIVVSLLKRGPIKHLYSTSYILSTESGEDIVDAYGSNYKIKFSTGLIEEQTFNQLSSGNFPAEVFTRSEASITSPVYTEGTYLYIKVDNMEYDGTGGFDFIVGDITQHITVPEQNGYARFDLSWFNGKTMMTFAQSIVRTFEQQGPEGSSLLKYEATVDNTIRIYTASSAFYSSIDFGNTSPTALYTLFGIEKSTIYSREGQIVANEISYKTLSMTNSLAIGKSIKIEVSFSVNGTPIDADVSIGYNLQNFIANLSESSVGQYVAISDLRLVFLSLTNGANIKFTVSWDNVTEHDVWEGMFTPEAWKNFIPIDGSTEASGTAVCTFVNEGDYYIYYDGTDYNLVIQNPDAFPYGDVYFHMYEDYSKDHIVESTDNIIRYTDEYIWNSLMTKKRVMLTEHVYKQPRFIPFDLSIICVLPNTKAFSSRDYNAEISEYLRTVYGLYSDNIGQEILPDDIIFSIKENFPDVTKVIVEYLGYDMSNSSTNKESLKTEFNQKHIIASTETTEDMVVDPETSIVIQKTIVKHGLKLALRYSAS